MLDETLFSSIATQMMAQNEVVVDGKTLTIGRTSSKKLRTLSFGIAGRAYPAIEQNQQKPSRWGELARGGHKVVQFKDLETNRFVAVAVDGRVTIYGHHDSTTGAARRSPKKRIG